MSMIEHIIKISEYFLGGGIDINELQRLISVAKDRQRWVKAHAYFDQIRDKNLKAIRDKQQKLECLYCYIEICYKTLFNLTYPSAPFDSDSPYFIIPIALQYCDVVGLERATVIDIIAG